MTEYKLEGDVQVLQSSWFCSGMKFSGQRTGRGWHCGVDQAPTNGATGIISLLMSYKYPIVVILMFLSGKMTVSSWD